MPRHVNRSFLHKMHIANIGCIGPEGLEIAFDDIVCLVGPNNSGKSTVLRAYEAAVGNQKLTASDFCSRCNGAAASVTLWVHIPANTPNIDEKWKTADADLLLVRSRWTWAAPNQAPERVTWDPEANDYAENGKAAGLDTVFSSRLPQPFRIEALDGPTEEHSRLLTLILQPIADELTSLIATENSAVTAKLGEFLTEARAPVQAFNEKIQKAQERVTQSYSKVFDHAELQLKIDLAAPELDPMNSLLRGSSLKVKEHDQYAEVGQQGTGSQRALFWSMLEVRSALKREADAKKNLEKQKQDLQKQIAKLKAKKLTKPAAIDANAAEIGQLETQLGGLNADAGNQQDISLPGFMLLIDEPEVALHPNAVRAAKDHLYSLARENGWQVMLTTHSPTFVDPTEDHTTIVRLERSGANPSPRTYRSDSVQFEGSEKQQLQMLLQFDPTVAELFFGSYPVLVEGDTEYAAFLGTMQRHPQDFPPLTRPAIIRADGKAVLLPLIKIMRAFKLSFSILHDADSPSRSDGSGNGMWTENAKIRAAIEACRQDGIRVVHRVSIPDFERRFALPEGDKHKPLVMWQMLAGDQTKDDAAAALLKEVISPDSAECLFLGQQFELKLTDAVKQWAAVHAQDDARYVFK